MNSAEQPVGKMNAINGGIFEDTHGVAWARMTGGGRWVRVSDRCAFPARRLRVLLRHRKDPRAARLAKRLDGPGWWASNALHLGY